MLISVIVFRVYTLSQFEMEERGVSGVWEAIKDEGTSMRMNWKGSSLVHWIY